MEVLVLFSDRMVQTNCRGDYYIRYGNKLQEQLNKPIDEKAGEDQYEHCFVQPFYLE